MRRTPRLSGKFLVVLALAGFAVAPVAAQRVEGSRALPPWFRATTCRR